MRSEAEVENALERYGDMIRRICFVHLQQNADVEDVFQNVFFKYAVRKEAFSTPTHEKAWLIRVAMNECNSLHRKFFHRKVELCDDLSDFGMNQTMEHPEVMEALLRLPHRYRDIIYLFYYEGYSLREIAQLMHKKESTIATWHRRSKMLLKDYLGGDVLEEPTF